MFDDVSRKLEQTDRQTIPIAATLQYRALGFRSALYSDRPYRVAVGSVGWVPLLVAFIATMLLPGCYIETRWLESYPVSSLTETVPRELGDGARPTLALKDSIDGVSWQVMSGVGKITSADESIFGFRHSIYPYYSSTSQSMHSIVLAVYTEVSGALFRRGTGAVRYMDDMSTLDPVDVRFERKDSCPMTPGPAGISVKATDEIILGRNRNVSPDTSNSGSHHAAPMDCIVFWYPLSLDPSRTYELTFGELKFPDGRTRSVKAYFVPRRPVARSY